MKIAQISHCYKPVVGGQQVYIQNLIEVLNQAGHESLVFQPDRGVKADDVRSVFRAKGIPRLVPGSESHLFDFFLRLFHQKEIAAHDVTIAHYALHAVGQKARADRTVVLSHGVEWNKNLVSRDDRKRYDAAKFCLGKYPHVVNDTDYLRTLGMDVKAAEGYFEEVSPNVWFVPNCVDGNRFKKVEPHESLRDKKVILVPRQITPDRGIDVAIDAFRLIADKDPELEMCILGNCGKMTGYRQTLDEMITKYGLEERVYFVPGVPNEEMPKWYSGSVLTLIPTLRREGTSLSALEAMSCGIPTVSTNVCGLADLPTAQCGPNPQKIADLMLETLADAEVVGKRQQEAVHQTFNLENWGEAWLSVVEKVASE